MNFATQLTHVETLSYYDRPLLEHWRDTNGQDFLMVWQDESQESVTWYAVPVNPETLAKFLEHDLDMAITLREVILAAPTIWRVEANSFVYDVTEGVALTPAAIPEDHMPLDGSYCHVDTYTDWEVRRAAGLQGEAPINIIDPVEPASPDEVETVPGANLDWPELDTVPSQLMDDSGCPWKQTNFL